MPTNREPPCTLELVQRSCPVCEGNSHHVVARGRDFEYDSCDNELTFVRCDNCATVFLNPRPAQRDFATIYPSDYYTNTESEGGGAGPLVRKIWERVERRRAQHLLGRLGSRPKGPRKKWHRGDRMPSYSCAGPKDLLDIGCGDGRFLNIVRDLVGPTWGLTGIEQRITAPMRELAADKTLYFFEGLYEDIDLGFNRFDLIVAQQMIEHAIEPKEVLRKMRTELRPGGLAVIDTPNFDGLDRRLFSESLWGGYHFPRHLTLFTPQTMARLAGAVELDIVEVRPMLSPVFWVMTAHNVAVKLGLPQTMTAHITYRSLPLLALATSIEIPNLFWGGQTSNMRVVLRKPRRS